MMPLKNHFMAPSRNFPCKVEDNEEIAVETGTEKSFFPESEKLAIHCRER
jgi:hypothetical protein